MTIANSICRTKELGNGSTTRFDFSFRILGQTEVAVYVDDVPMAYGTGEDEYTVEWDEEIDGGTVVFGTAPAYGATVVILRNTPLLQPTDIQNNTAFYAEVLEGMGDRAEMQIQQIAEKVNRAVVVPPSQENGMTTDEFKENITSALNAAVTAASGYADNANDAADSAGDKANDALNYADNAEQYMGYASGYMTSALTYRNQASGYADNAAAAVAVVEGGMQIHPLSELTISNGTCTIPYKNGHVYSGAYPVVSGNATASTFLLTPDASVQNDRQCTFELHLRHGATAQTAKFVNSMIYRGDNGVYGSGTSAAIAATANTVQNLTIRTALPTGAGAQVYLVNEATVRVKEGDEA